MNFDSSPGSSSFQVDEFYLDLQADGRTISLLTDEQISARPFPGLRPFKTSEFELFKGRDGQAEELMQRLRSSHFLAVIGSSGTGKSSLVRAGLIPQLFGGFLHKAGSSWRIAICRPGQDPIRNLAIALTNIKTGQRTAADLLKENEKIEPLLRSSSYGILEVNKILKQDSKTDNPPNLLIIIDQFEELFRFDRRELKKEDAYANIENDFVQLLLKASSEIDPGIYVVLTMRSEFLGDCVKYRGLPEIINKSQYLVPQLNRDQLKDVIESPVIRAKKKVSAELVEILVNEIESEKLKENLDQLPILQHALMHTYNKTFRSGGNETEMRYEHYDSIGGMKGALAKHAKEVFDDLADKVAGNANAGTALKDHPKAYNKKQRIAKLIFQALTDSTSDQKGGRRPTRLQNIYSIASFINASETEVDEVINYFRQVDTSFIMPPENTKLYPDLMLDISHESLMRNWPELKDWMAEEVKNARLYEILDERREQFDRDSEAYLRGILLRDLLAWKNEGLHNAAWASRYQPVNENSDTPEKQKRLYRKNLDFLDICAGKVAEEEREKEKQAKSRIRNNRLVAIVSIAAAVISLAFGVYAFGQRSKAQAAERKALDQAEIAVRQKKTTDSVNNIVEAQSVKLEDALTRANNSRDTALMAKDSIVSLLFSNKLLLNTSNAIRDALAKSRDLVATNVIEGESFYGLLDEQQKATAMSLLKPLKIIGDPKYKTVTQAISLAVSAKSQARKDPNIGLVESYQAVKTDMNPITAEINQKIFSNYLFYQQDISLKEKTRSMGTVHGLKYNAREAKLMLNFENSICFFDFRNGRLNPHSNNCLTQPEKKDSRYSLSYDALDLYYDKVQQYVSYLKKEAIYVNRIGRGDTILVIEFPFSISMGAFFPDGKSVALVSLANDSVYSWSISTQKMLYAFSLAAGSNSYRYVRSLKVDSGTGDLILGFSDGTIEIRDQKNGLVKRRLTLGKLGDSNQVDVNSIDISENGILAALNSATGVVNIFDFRANTIPLEHLQLNSINGYNINFISPDGRSVLAFGPGGGIVVDRKSGATKIIYDEPESIELQSGSDLRFLDNNTFIIYNNKSIKLWMIDPGFTGSEIVWKSKNKPALSILNQIEAGLFNFNDISTISDVEFLNKNVSEVLDKLVDRNPYSGNEKEYSSNQKYNYLDIASTLNERLGQITNYKNKGYLVSQIQIAFLYNAIDQLSGKQDYKKWDERISTIVNKLPVIPDESSEIDSANMAYVMSGLAWVKFFSRDTQGALQAAEKGFSFDNENSVAIKNLALAYLLNKQYVKAENIYVANRDEKFVDMDVFDNRIFFNHYRRLSNKETYFREVFLEDMAIVQKAGLISDTDPGWIQIRRVLSQQVSGK
jgi:hypothetical protein